MTASHVRAVVQRHFDELAAQCVIGGALARDPRLSAVRARELRQRMRAHAEGLCIAASQSEPLARAALESSESGAVAAGAIVLFMLESDVDEIVAALRSPDPRACEGVRIGLRIAGIERLRPRLLEIASSDETQAAASALDVLAFHDRAVPVSPRRRLDSDSPLVRELAIEAMGRVPGEFGADDLATALADRDASVRGAALRAAARSKSTVAIDVCRDHVDRKGPAYAEALAFLGVCGDPTDVPRLVHHATSADAELAVAALGALGFEACLSALVERVEPPATRAAARAAWERITGRPYDEAVAGRTLDPDRGEGATASRWQHGVCVSTDPIGVLDELPAGVQYDLILRATLEGLAAARDIESDAWWNPWSRVDHAWPLPTG